MIFNGAAPEERRQSCWTRSTFLESKVVSDAQARFPDPRMLFEINLLAFQEKTETLHKDPAGREVRALVHVEDIRPASLQGICERFNAEVDLHCYG